MTRLAVFSSVLVVLVVAVGCGDSDSSHRNASATGGETSVQGTGGKSAGGAVGEGGSSSPATKPTETKWLYGTDDEGVFPKDRVLDIKVTMPEAAWNQLLATASQEVWSTAEVTIDGQKLGTIGIRPKGSYSLDSCFDTSGKLICDKLSYKLKFDQSDPDGRFYGLKKLALNQILDGGALFMETLGYQVFNDFGIVAPRSSYATLTINGNSHGIYTVAEVIDGRFTDTHFNGGNGNLYKEAWPDRTEGSYFTAALETNKSSAKNDAFIAFATDMLAAKDDALPATLDKYMDLDKMVDYMAVDYAIANWDGITTFYAGTWGHANHNFYMYQSEDAARFTLIPWDLNATFFLDHWLGDIQPWDTLDVDCSKLIVTRDSPDLFTMPAACDPTIRAIALSKDKYRASVQRLLDEVFIVEKLRAKVDAYLAQVSDAMTKDPFVSAAEATGGANYIKSQLSILRARLELVLTAQ